METIFFSTYFRQGVKMYCINFEFFFLNCLDEKSDSAHIRMYFFAAFGWYDRICYNDERSQPEIHQNQAAITKSHTEALSNAAKSDFM